MISNCNQTGWSDGQSGVESRVAWYSRTGENRKTGTGTGSWVVTGRKTNKKGDKGERQKRRKENKREKEPKAES